MKDMEAKELRIGNLVEINGQSIQMDIKMFHAVIHGFPGYEPKPIELTEEWLIRCGFKDDITKGWFYLNLDDCFYLAKNPDGFYLAAKSGIPDVNMEINVKYVHQLQNLYYALTGTEI